MLDLLLLERVVGEGVEKCVVKIPGPIKRELTACPGKRARIGKPLKYYTNRVSLSSSFGMPARKSPAAATSSRLPMKTGVRW